MYLQKPVDKEIQVNIEDIPTIGCSAGPIKVENRASQGIYTIDLHDQEGSTAISTAKNGNGTIRSKRMCVYYSLTVLFMLPTLKFFSII